jgi:hypothetical protein
MAAVLICVVRWVDAGMLPPFSRTFLQPRLFNAYEQMERRLAAALVAW